jgi:hypothetical protein
MLRYFEEMTCARRDRHAFYLETARTNREKRVIRRASEQLLSDRGAIITDKQIRR